VTPGRSRWFGSIRILRDGRMRFSPWTYPALPFAFWVMDMNIIVLRGGVPIMHLWPERNRVVTASLDYLLRPDQLREAVRDLRRAGHGLERWIVPALEWNLTHPTAREKHPDTYAILPELLESCRDLPVAEQWTRIRASVISNAEKARAEREAEKAAQGKDAEEGTPAGKPSKTTGSKPSKATGSRPRKQPTVGNRTGRPPRGT